MMVINNNLPALNAYDIVNNTSNQLQKSIQKLSTGLRINSAADDAAGLSISEKMRAQINGLDQAVRNTQDGISLIQTAEGALTETHSILQRMRELSVQAANDTYTAQDRSYIQEEVDQLVDEINHIGNTTTFNTKKLLNGDSAVLWSSSDNTTKAIVNGGLRTIDQFGQKSSAEGNYKITVTSTAGTGEVQKTDIFKLKHNVSPWYADVDTTKGIAASDKQTAPDIKGGGIYNVTTGTTLAAAQASVVTKTSQAGGAGAAFTTTTTAGITTNADLSFKVASVDTSVSGKESVTFTVSGKLMAKDGTVSDFDEQKITFSAESPANVTFKIGGTDTTWGWGTNADNITSMAKKLKVGDEMTYNVTATGAGGDLNFTVTGDPETGTMTNHRYVLTKDQINDKQLDFAVSYTETDNDTGSQNVEHGTVSLTTTDTFSSNVKDSTRLASYYKNVDVSAYVEEAGRMTTLDSSVASASTARLPEKGTYTVSAQTATDTGGNWSVLQASRKDHFANGDMVMSGAGKTASGILELSVTSVTESDTDTDAELKVNGKFYGMTMAGAAINGASINELTFTGADLATAKSITDGTSNFGMLNLKAGSLAAGAGVFKVGDKIYLQVEANSTANSSSILTVTGESESGDNIFSSYTPRYVITPDANKTYTMAGLVFDGEGDAIDFSTALANTSTNGQLAITTSTTGTNAAALNGKTLATLKWGVDNPTEIKSSIGEIADGTSKLRDIDKFWDSQGNFMLEDPQTIRITQGDGQNTTITLYANDTLDNVAEKINNAIANDLGQGKYVDINGADKFATYVDSATEETSESVRGTMIIRSAVPGASGTLTFSSNNEDLINALSLNTIQQASESTYRVTVEDAHTGKVVNGIENEKITGNVLVGRLHKNVDVEFDNLTGISATWNDATKKFDTSSSSEGEVTYLHLADNTTVFQIGANEGDDLGINIGDMRAHALGVDKVLVTDHDSASRSISIIDKAIDKVSTQRAKLGAYQNRLEHTAANLTTSAENLTASESRIRDTDMAKTMMDFTKLQIMLQAGNSMLAQANQLPQNVLSLIR